MTFTLARLFGEDMAPVRLTPLKPVSSLAKTLRRCPVGLQLRHELKLQIFSLFGYLEDTSKNLKAGQLPAFASGCSLLFWPDQHDHLPTFHHRKLFDLADRRQLGLDPT